MNSKQYLIYNFSKKYPEILDALYAFRCGNTSEICNILSKIIKKTNEKGT